MSKTYYIYSTLTASNRYLNHEEGGGDLPVPQGEGVLIRGGSGVAGEFLQTPRGVATKVTEEEVEYLRRNPVFQMHEKGGWVQVSDKEADADVVAADMANRDGSSPSVEADYEEDKAPKTSATKSKAK